MNTHVIKWHPILPLRYVSAHVNILSKNG
eukprot:COSAG05_NODE_9208_length_639_cov_2.827778_1_plen_28_part_10